MLQNIVISVQTFSFNILAKLSVIIILIIQIIFKSS